MEESPPYNTAARSVFQGFLVWRSSWIPLPGPLGFTASSPKRGQSVAAPVGVRSSSRQKVPRAARLDGQLGTVWPQLIAASFLGFLPRVLIYFFKFISLLCCVTHEAPEQRAKLARIGGKNGEFEALWLLPPTAKVASRLRSLQMFGVGCGSRCAGRSLPGSPWPTRAANAPACSSQPSCAFLAPFPARPLPLLRLGSGAGSGKAMLPLVRRNVCLCLNRGGVLPRLQNQELACPFLTSLLLNSCSSRTRPCEAASC